MSTRKKKFQQAPGAEVAASPVLLDKDTAPQLKQDAAFDNTPEEEDARAKQTAKVLAELEARGSTFMKARPRGDSIQLLSLENEPVDYRAGGALHPRWVSKSGTGEKVRRAEGYVNPKEVHSSFEDLEVGDLKLMLCRTEGAEARQRELAAASARMAGTADRNTRGSGQTREMQIAQEA